MRPAHRVTSHMMNDMTTIWNTHHNITHQRGTPWESGTISGKVGQKLFTDYPSPVIGST